MTLIWKCSIYAEKLSPSHGLLYRPTNYWKIYILWVQLFLSLDEETALIFRALLFISVFGWWWQKSFHKLKLSCTKLSPCLLPIFFLSCQFLIVWSDLLLSEEIYIMSKPPLNHNLIKHKLSLVWHESCKEYRHTY